MRTYGCALALILLFTTFSYSQDIPELTAKDSIIKSSWIFGLGVNIVDDSGDAFEDFTTTKDQWNIVPFPSRISIGRYFKSGLGLEAIGTYNVYKEGNIIDGVVNPEDKDYYAIDARLSYDLNRIFGQTGWFDPYLGGGIGYTEANDIGRGTYNATIGFRTWFSDRWGLDLNSSGKWSIGNEATNHIQHGAAVVYQFGIEKGLSKKGEEKLALIQQLEEEQQREQDSIAAARQAEAEAQALAERMAREKEEAARRAAEEAEQARKTQLENQIKGLGKIYFAFNSSSLNQESKATLDQLANLMNENNGIKLQVNAHTDSRGPETYNQVLSQKRAENTVSYLLSKGIADDRMEANGFGESQPVNNCTDGVPCSAAEHRANRRSEFIVLEL
ncbi:OmpA family protein [Zeaxanthinibacter sp. PT1]|uniref:OmpA family protein n=1 Tax=Zeaxanthinibacter TaxID=561554 RepID=UPI00234AEEB3|nr:OmpA family protein [Zeaxanthinibacter sp. PT1]MDC6352761.1 OmpA family protein [Zeaxanthinibacter sp. PT1]